MYAALRSAVCIFHFLTKRWGSGQAHIFCALLTEESDHYAGQVAGNQSGYFPLVENTFSLDDRKPLTIFHSGNTKFIGKVQKLKIERRPHLVAVMLPKPRNTRRLYGRYSLKLPHFCSLPFWPRRFPFSGAVKKYVAPILQGLEQIKTSTDRAQGRIPRSGNRGSLLLSSQSRTGHMRQLYPLYSRSGWKRRAGRSGCKANWNKPAMILGPRRQKLPDLPIPGSKRSIPTIFNIFGRD